jgi:hypothetical protein
MQAENVNTILDCYLSNLHTIGSIKPGQKISTAKKFLVVDEDSIFQWWYRGRRGDCGDKSTEVITREVYTVLEILKQRMESKYLTVHAAPQFEPHKRARIEELKKIRLGLTVCRPGVRNISETYRGDENITTPLRQLLNEITSSLDELARLLRDLGEQTELVDVREIKK